MKPPFETIDFIEFLDSSDTTKSEANLPEISVPKPSSLKFQIIAKDEALARNIGKTLMALQMPFESVYLEQIGYLKNHVSNIIPLIKDSIEQDRVTVLIGYDQKITKAVFDALQFDEKPFSCTQIQSSMGLDGLDRLFMELKEPWLFSSNLLATQANFSAPGYGEENEAMGLSSTRLGLLRSSLAMAEPEIRFSDLFSLDLNAIKHADAPFQSKANAIGLTAEEACQLSYYAGRGERNRVFSLFGIKEGASDLPLAQSLLSTIIWYFIHGLNHRRSMYPPDTSAMQEYVIESPINGLELRFLKDNLEQKWWLKQPLKQKAIVKIFPLIACDYDDYSQAVNEQILSDRLEHLYNLLVDMEKRNKNA